MKFRFALLATLVVVAAPLAAQGGRRGGGGMNVDNMATMYTLSADQKTRTDSLVKIFTAGTAATQAWIRSEAQAGAVANADSAKKVADARARFNADFKALLTPDQAKKFDSVQANPPARRGGGGGGR